MVRLRDEAIVLVPKTANDEFTGRPRAIDWSQDPDQHHTPFAGEPIAVRSQNVDEETTLAKWRGYLGPTITVDGAPVPVDTIVTPACRIRWHGTDYSIDGAVGVHRRAGQIRYATVILKLVNS